MGRSGPLGAGPVTLPKEGAGPPLGKPDGAPVWPWEAGLLYVGAEATFPFLGEGVDLENVFAAGDVWTAGLALSTNSFFPLLSGTCSFSVPVIWARILNERDWEVPVRGCQSSVSSIRRFLLASLRGGKVWFISGSAGFPLRCSDMPWLSNGPRLCPMTTSEALVLE